MANIKALRIGGFEDYENMGLDEIQEREGLYINSIRLEIKNLVDDIF